MKVLALVGVTGICFGVLNHGIAAQQQDRFAQVGRYEMEAVEGRLFVLDTTNGQCWSRVRRDSWIDEGNPTTRRRSRKTKPAPQKLELPERVVRMTIRQRQFKSLPGSDGSVQLQVQDVTAGQVLVSLRTRDGKLLLDETSLKAGEIARFRFNDTSYVLRIRELKNVLIGEDFAVVEVAGKAEDLPELEPAESKSDRDTEPEN